MSLLSAAESELLQGTWPLALLEDPAKGPRVVESAAEFLRELLLGSPSGPGDFVVLPRGTELLGLGYEETLPSDLRQALDGCSSACDFVARVGDRVALLERYRACFKYIGPSDGRAQRRILPGRRVSLGERVVETRRLMASGKVDPALVYVTELKLQRPSRHPVSNALVKTVCMRGVKDVLGPYAAWTLYWCQRDEGLFVGSKPSGTGVHVDQVLWSNVGKNWRGYKLIASWPAGAVSERMLRDFGRMLLHPPLSDRERSALAQAAKVVLVRPGDVFFFSGASAHTSLCVSEGISVTAYESFVSLHPANVELLLRSGGSVSCEAGGEDGGGAGGEASGEVGGDAASEAGKGCDAGSMRVSSYDLLALKRDVLAQLSEAASQLACGGPAAGAPAAAADGRWRQLIASLHSDGAVQRTLPGHYASAVARCARDGYLRSRMPREVVEACGACGGLVEGDDEVQLNNAKRPRKARSTSSSSSSSAAEKRGEMESSSGSAFTIVDAAGDVETHSVSLRAPVSPQQRIKRSSRTGATSAAI